MPTHHQEVSERRPDLPLNQPIFGALSSDGEIHSPSGTRLVPRRLLRRHLPLRFALGALRLGHVAIPVQELDGHFLVNPIRLPDLMAAHDAGGGQHPTFGRSVVLGETPASVAATNLYVLYTYPRYYVDVRMSFADYLARFSSKSRWTLNHKVRKFKTTSGGTIDWSTFRTPEEMDRFLAEALPLSERTYQHRLFGTGLSRSDAFRKELAGLAHENRVRGWLLRLQGQPIAYLCAPASVGRVLTYDYVGFDAAYGALSPGTVLQYLVLQQLCEERAFDYFDFTEGDGDHKAFFATHTLYCADVLVRGSAFAPRAWLTCHRAFAVAARLTLEAADKAGVRRRLKKLIAANVDAKRVEDSGHSLPHLERPKDGGSTASVGRVHPMTSAIVEQATASEMRASAWYDG